MAWQIYLLVSILLISFNGLFHRSLMKDDKSNPQAQTIVFLGLGGCIAFVITLIRGRLHLAIPSSLFLNFIILILLSTPAYLLLYRSYQLLGASEVVLFLTTGRLWNIVGAFLFLHEAVTIQRILGAIVIMLGIGIVLYDKKKFTINRGVVFVLIAAFLFGMNDINSFYSLKSFNATNFLIYSEFLPIVALLIIQPKIVKKLTYYFSKGNALKVSLLSLCDAVGTLALYLSFQAGGKASVIGPLSATRVLASVLIATVILHERNNLKNKIIGAIVTMIGVFLLI